MAPDRSAIEVRAAAARDLAPVRELLSQAGLPTEGLEDQFGERYAVAEVGSNLVGAIGVEVHGRSGLLRSAVVAPLHRGTGLGRQLTRERIAWAERQGLDALYLLTTTAAPFFARLGFAHVPRASAPAELQASREFATICGSSAVCMRLALRG